MEEFKYLSRNFIGVSLGNFLFFSSFYLMLPVLPLFVSDMGGTTSQIGFVIGLFTLSSALFRAYFGKVADIYGLRKCLLIGAFFFMVPFIAYMYIESVYILYVIRFFHGLAQGVYLAAAFGYVAMLAPANRRGEVMGIFGIMNIIALSACPAIGMLFISYTKDYNLLFALCLAMVVATFISIYFIDERIAVSKEKASAVSLVTVIKRRPVIAASIVLFTGAAAYGSIISFLPVYSPTNTGLFFSTYAIFTILFRILTGKLSDKIGRYKTLLPFIGISIIAMGLLAVMNNIITMLIAAALFGMGFGSFMPVLNAYIIDEVIQEERTTALGVYSACMEGGMAFGSIIFGAVAEMQGFSFMYITTAAFIFIGLITFTFLGKPKSEVLVATNIEQSQN